MTAMTRKKPTRRSPEPPDGVTLVRTLRGHTAGIGRIAWSPDGRLLASPSADGTIRLWDAASGTCLHVLQEAGELVSVALDSSGEVLAVGTKYGVSLWDVARGRRVRKLGDSRFRSIGNHAVSVAFHPRNPLLAVLSPTGTVTFWETPAGRLLQTIDLEGPSRAIAFDPTGRTLATAGRRLYVFERNRDGLEWRLRVQTSPSEADFFTDFDPEGHILVFGGRDAVKLHDAQTGKPLRALEGHQNTVDCVDFSPDGRLLASKSNDDTVRLWRCDTWETVAIIPERKTKKHWWPGLAFHPQLPFLATVGSDSPTSDPREDEDEESLDRVIHIWELDLAVLLAKKAPLTITYTSAKIVLVGESNVGKSYLAHRIATGEAPTEGTIHTTHGMKFWPVVPERLSTSALPPQGQRRDVIFWDMGGQDEYRLVHQLFLHDTTLALVLFDPTRGRTAFEEVEAWNRRLEKQLHERPAAKLLVGTKLDRPSELVDRIAVEQLERACGFVGYYETSALNGRGVPELCKGIAGAIDWDELGKTSRPELFQRIRDQIEARREQGEVVLNAADLQNALSDGPTTDEETSAVEAVTDQLATQGVIARSRVSTGESVLVIQVQEIERYAGSLIIAARNNPRGVPALELGALAKPDLVLPGILTKDRLQRNHEQPVIECTVQLLLEHGICFQHEGLLVFPTLFDSPQTAPESGVRRAASLYYDFAGAIDNIYASLVAWLVLARNFGRVRLWAERAEFEVAGQGVCGLRKVARPGGFAHVDVYFDAGTPVEVQNLFVSFVEEHLRLHGVDIREHLAVACPCGHQFEEETLRKRIARGDTDVPCPVCETRHRLAGGAPEARQRSPKMAEKIWALKTEIEKRRQKSAEHAVQVLERTAEASRLDGPIRLLHLSDLHLTGTTPIAARLQWLFDDLKHDAGLNLKRLDYVVISGDFTDRGGTEGFEKAYEFVSGLTQEFGLSAERCIFVPGNHDVKDLRGAYDWRETSDGLKDGEWVKQGEIVLARNPEKYPLRFKPFSDGFFHKFLQKPYPTDYPLQGMAIPFWETGLQFLALNSCWQIDQFNRKRAGMHPEAVAHVLREAQRQETQARNAGELAPGGPLLRIAVWHHAVAGPEQMKDVEFIGHLQNNGVRISLHGDVHELRRELVGYWHHKKLHIVGSGSFAAPPGDRPESTPRLYNLLEIDSNLRSARVHTRQQPRADGPWKGWNEWPRPDGGEGAVPYYDIRW